MNQENMNDEMEIDLLDLAYMLLDHWHYLLVCLLAGALVFNIYAFFGIAPTYQSTSKLYVVSASDDSVVNLSDLNLGTSLTADYEELMLSYPVLNRVIDKLKLDMDYEELRGLYTLNNPTDTRVLQITATTTDPQLSMDLAEAMAEVSVSYLPETMSTLLGLVLCCGVLVVRYLMDDTIHTAEDMEKYFGTAPLTTIPDSTQVEDMEERYYKNKKKGKEKRSSKK